MSKPESEPHLKERDVAYLVKLHLDTVCLKAPHPSRQDEFIYEVEGKPRPMLIIRVLPKRDRGVHWVLAVALTTSCPRARKDQLRRIGNCVNEKVVSYVETEVHKLPETMRPNDANGSAVIKRLDRYAFDHVIKIISHGLLQTNSGRVNSIVG